MNFLKETLNGYLQTRHETFSGIFELKSDDLREVKDKVAAYVTSLVLTGLVLNFAMLFIFPIEGLSFFLRPALYTTLVMVGVLMYMIKTKDVRGSLFLTLFTALMLLMASLALSATPRHTLWVLLLIFLAYLVEGAKRGIIWLLITTAIIIGLVVLSDRGVIASVFDQKILAALLLIALTTSVAFLLHDITLMQYFKIFRASNRKLAEENARRFAVIDAIADGIITTDESGNITYLNEKATKLLGIKSLEAIEKVVGKPLLENIDLLDIHNNPIAHESRPEAYVLRTGRHINTENASESYRMKRIDGSTFPIETAISPVRAGQINYGIIQLFRDVSWQQEINSAKNEFVSLASHQLRTPLASIKWNCEMLEWPENYESMTDDQKNLFSQIKKSALGMADLVSALLDISRMELGTLEFKLEKIDLSDIAREAEKSAQAQVANRHGEVTLSNNIEEGPLWIKADRRFMRMIVDNLLSNAIKYTPKGTVDITVSTIQPNNVNNDEIKEPGVLITVKDSGYGIPEKQQSQIFSKMFRADNVRTTNVGGTGLGLYLVHTSILKMGGLVWFESKENVGTTFYVYFPEYK